MAGKPERAFPKALLYVSVSKEVYRDSQHLYHNPICPFRSFSQMLETIMFAAKHEYVERPAGEFVKICRQTKAEIVLSNPSLEQRPQTRHIQATIDREAREFLDLLAAYRGVFSSQGEVVEILLHRAVSLSYDSAHLAYYSKRLKQVMICHPTRRDLPSE
ncbi:MAG: hypothetical protein LUD25_02180 [Coriobacteriaceae bacterium]|nr:hypothetical protein [Coriobacteriaceae bacterium]